MKKYTITLNERQLVLISHCLEDCHRFLSGDLELFHTTSVLNNSYNIKERLQELHSLVVPELHYNYGQHTSYSWSGGDCPNKIQKQKIAETYYLYREILHQLNVNAPDWNVYKSETLRCEDSGDCIEIKEIKQ